MHKFAVAAVQAVGTLIALLAIEFDGWIDLLPLGLAATEHTTSSGSRKGALLLVPRWLLTGFDCADASRSAGQWIVEHLCHALGQAYGLYAIVATAYGLIAFQLGREPCHFSAHPLWRAHAESSSFANVVNRVSSERVPFIAPPRVAGDIIGVHWHIIDTPWPVALHKAELQGLTRQTDLPEACTKRTLQLTY